MKKPILVFLSVGIILIAGVFFVLTQPNSAANARTNCDLQAKPALSCPPGYSIMCIPTGGDHWGCGKESRDGIIEVTTEVLQNSNSDASITQLNTEGATQAKTENAFRETEQAIPSIDACQAKCREQYGGSGSAGFDACIRACNQGGGAEKVIDTTSQINLNEDTTKLTPRLSQSLVVKKVEVRGWDAKKKEEFLATVKEYAQIQSEQDLENFARGVLVKDDKIEDVTLKEESVQITYKMPAKFLGLFKTSLSVGVKSTMQTQVKVSYPWFKIFFSKPVKTDALETEIVKELEATKKTMEDADSAIVAESVYASFQKQAQVLQVITNVSKNFHDMSKSIIRNMK